MLDRERADFFRTLEALRDQLSQRCVAVHLPIGAEHELTGVVDLLHMKAYTSPEAEREAAPIEIPAEMAEPGRRVPREAARLRGGDGRGADGALPRRPGALRRGGRPRAQGRGHARRDLPGRVRGRDEEPRHDRAARPARRGRPLAGEEAHRPAVSRATGRRRSCSRRSPILSPAGSTCFRVISGRVKSDSTLVERIARTRRSASASSSRCRARSTPQRRIFRRG